MSKNNIKPLVDVKPPRLLKELRADMVKMVKNTDGWDWPFKRIPLDSGINILTAGKVLFIEPCIDEKPGEETVYFTDLLILLEVGDQERFTYMLLMIAADVDEWDVECGFTHLYFSEHILYSVARCEITE